MIILLFLIVLANSQLNSNIINLRKKREKKSIINLKNKVISKINNLQEFHKWFHNEHNCYNCNFGDIKNIDENIKKSY